MLHTEFQYMNFISSVILASQKLFSWWQFRWGVSHLSFLADIWSCSGQTVTFQRIWLASCGRAKGSNKTGQGLLVVNSFNNFNQFDSWFTRWLPFRSWKRQPSLNKSRSQEVFDHLRFNQGTSDCDDLTCDKKMYRTIIEANKTHLLNLLP